MNETNSWSLRLFKKSILKQEKLKAIFRFLNSTKEKKCLDIGGDNGIISYYLREKEGDWASADLEEGAVNSIRSLVKTNVYKINGRKTPFADNTFDIVVIIDFLEHISTDKIFINELKRIMKEGSILIVNVPYLKKFSFLKILRNIIGLTDEKHGHIRPGYNLEQLGELFKDKFEILDFQIYSRFFTELLDTILVFVYTNSRKNKKSKKGILLTKEDFKQNEKMFKIYSLIYPFIWLISKLDYLLFFTKGYSLIVKAQKKG